MIAEPTRLPPVDDSSRSLTTIRGPEIRSAEISGPQAAEIEVGGKAESPTDRESEPELTLAAPDIESRATETLPSTGTRAGDTSRDEAQDTPEHPMGEAVEEAVEETIEESAALPAVPEASIPNVPNAAPSVALPASRFSSRPAEPPAEPTTTPTTKPIPEPLPRLDLNPLPSSLPPLPPMELEGSRVRLQPPFGQPRGAGTVPMTPRLQAPPSSEPGRSANRIAPEYRLNAGMAERAEALARKGMSLTVRGAFYSAKAEFIQALRLVAQGLDAETGGVERSRALANGLRALEEAESFLPRGSHLEADLNLATLVQAHRTPVLKDRDASDLSPLAAMHEYYNYAQEQFCLACGHEPAASLALFGLGKIETVMGAGGNTQNRSAIPRAIAFHHASTMVDGSNYRAANELGVLLAKCGQWQQAREVLQVAAQTYPQTEIWHNLATVHERLGETKLAAQARTEWRRSQSLPKDGGFGVGGSPEELVQWMNVRDFVKNSGDSPSDMQPIVTGRSNNAAGQSPASRTAKQPWKTTPGQQWER